MEGGEQQLEINKDTELTKSGGEDVSECEEAEEEDEDKQKSGSEITHSNVQFSFTTVGLKCPTLPTQAH